MFDWTSSCRDADEIETWMLEKLQLAQEENYKVENKIRIESVFLDLNKGQDLFWLTHEKLLFVSNQFLKIF